MARNFRRPRQSHPIAELNITNLVDLGFTLLIIFMIATPLINQEQTIPVNLPTTAKVAQKKPDSTQRFVAVAVDAKGNYYMEGRPTPVPFVEVQSRLRAYAAEPKPPVLRIQGDGHAAYDKIAQLFAEMAKDNLLNFTIDTKVPER